MEFDAAVMDGTSVSYGASGGITKAFSAARLVMELSPHSVLVGEGAKTFALANGIELTETLTDDARQQVEDLRRQHLEAGNGLAPERGESHDTVGLICLDENGNLCAGSSTSGWKFKHPGRVGVLQLLQAGCTATHAWERVWPRAMEKRFFGRV
ncbi:unnamed protein product [Hapterophycus canaliculatus]